MIWLGLTSKGCDIDIQNYLNIIKVIITPQNRGRMLISKRSSAFINLDMSVGYDQISYQVLYVPTQVWKDCSIVSNKRGEILDHTTSAPIYLYQSLACIAFCDKQLMNFHGIFVCVLYLINLF